MTHRRQSQIALRKQREPVKTTVVPSVSSAQRVLLFDPWGALESLSGLSGLPFLSPEKSHAWMKNWTVLWSDQIRRCAFYLKWPMGLR